MMLEVIAKYVEKEHIVQTKQILHVFHALEGNI